MTQKAIPNCGKTCMECGVNLPTGKGRNGRPWGPLCHVCEEADEEKHSKYKALSWAILLTLEKRVEATARGDRWKILGEYLDTLKQLRAEL